MKTRLLLLIVLFVTGAISSCTKEEHNGDYPIQPVTFTKVKLSDDFWAPRLKTNHDVTIPIAFEQSEKTGRIKNFKIAGGLEEGEFQSHYQFDDSDVFKIIEGASYSLQTTPDPDLEAYLDRLISYIAAAQEEDGYLYTVRTIMGNDDPKWVHVIGTERWQKIHIQSHELYNLGHMYEAAVAHYQATGKRSFLDIAIKSADLLLEVFGEGKIENYPGHQEIEIGLVKLSRITNNKDYLDLARFFLDVRGPDKEEYNQAHKPVTEQTKAVGHAVRATYMYSGMADVAALTNDPNYIHAIDEIWKDVVYKKLYITGGIGASGGNEGFAGAYELPNMSAYCETCASIANVFWNHRMFLHKGDVKYYDVLERTLYNGLLSGISLSGDRFFYPNPLASRGQHERKEWFGCACCPSNLSRFIPSLPGYIYAKDEKSIYINLFMDNTARIDFNDHLVEIKQSTDYPWDGKIIIDVNPEIESRFELKVRIPGWARGESVPGDLYRFYSELETPVLANLNGQECKMNQEVGYLTIKRKWEKGDQLEVVFPMPVRRNIANPKVEDNLGHACFQRGPLVYCFEWPDNPDAEMLHLMISKEEEVQTTFENELLGGLVSLSVKGWELTENENKEVLKQEKDLKAIPYYAWAHRGKGSMSVWIPHQEQFATPKPYPSIASKAKPSASHPKGNLEAVNDMLVPEKSSSHKYGYLHWWPRNNTMEYLQYDFDEVYEVQAVEVFWFDDEDLNAGCRVPLAWKLFYMDENSQWKPVKHTNEYGCKKDQINRLDFKPVKTKALKMEVQLQENYSSGVQEWSVL